MKSIVAVFGQEQDWESLHFMPIFTQLPRDSKHPGFNLMRLIITAALASLYYLMKL
jgi:hypothetical protein